MDTLTTIIFFIFGAIIGSFLNVVILRYNTGLSLDGRSGCMSCAKKLKWYELFPIVSFIFLRAKCSKCRSPISWQYPLVELGTAVLFAATYVKFFGAGTYMDIVQVGLYLIILSLLVVITVYDIRHSIIPDGLVFAYIFIAAIRMFFTYPFISLFHYPFLLDLLAGPILFVPFFLLWFLSRGRWMGFGDAKLVLGIGFTLGITGGISAVILAFWIGAIASLSYLALAQLARTKTVHKLGLAFRLKRLTIKSEIPFAPYLILGMLIVLFFDFSLPGLSILFGL